jgi:nucleoside-diphosphate-sugar epimerase
MRVLIIGGTGVLSSAVSIEAIRQNMGLTMINRGNHMDLIPHGATLIKANNNDFVTIENSLKGQRFDAIIDFLCLNNEEITKSYNFYKNYTNQYFFISSCAVYDTTNCCIINEDSPKVLPMWKYSVDKWSCEELLVKLAKKDGINYTVIRPSVTYGNTRIPYGITPAYGYHWTLVERALHGKPIIRWNGGNNRCNMARVEDFAVGVVGLIGNEKAYNEAFNVCGDEVPTFNDVIDAISKWIKREVPTIDIDTDYYAKELSDPGELLQGRAIDSVNSNEKLKAAVPAFKQSITLKEGVALTLQSYKDNHFQRGISWSFDAECDRIIMSWCKLKRTDVKRFNLGFIDYLGSATKADKIQYWMEFHKNNVIAKILKLSLRVARRLHLC